MTLLERFRRRPRWEHPDAEVRATAVRELDDQELLERIARSDADPRVRRAAVRKLSAPAALGGLAAGDADEAVREAATGALLARAMGQDGAAAEACLAFLAETRHLVTLARTAPVAPVRQGALSRIKEARALATLARTAEDPAIREQALARVDDATLVAEVAAKSEHKDVALAAVERLRDPEALEAVASRARHRAAARRARVRLEALPRREPPVALAAVPVVAGPAQSSPEPAAVEGADPEPESADAEPGAAAPQPATLVPEPTAVPETAAVAPAPSLSPSEPPVLAVDAVAEPARKEAEEPRKQPAPAPPHDRERRERERREALARLEALCARLEGFAKAEGLTLREADAALREAKGALGALPGAAAKLGQRLKAARAALFARTQELREADEWSRWANATVQEELCRRVESLAPREDLEQVARELHDADARWAEVRQAPKDQAEALRQRYQAARSQVRGRLDAYFARKAVLEAERLKEKEALCARAEALADSTDWLKASEELKALQRRWKEVPTWRRPSQALWTRFRAACDRFFNRRQEDLKRRKEEWAANLARKEALCARAEALAESSDWDAAAAETRKLQAEWKTIGPVRKSRSEAVWQRFHKACDAFFERYKRRHEVELAAHRAAHEAICQELEALAPSGAEGTAAPERLAEKALDVLARGRQAPPLPPEHEAAFARRLTEARDRLLTAYPESFRGTDLDPEANRARKEKLCGRVEAVLAAAQARRGGEPALSGEALARRLKEALAANTIGGAVDAEAQRRAAAEEVEAAQAAWKRIGPVPGEAGAVLEGRFRKACSRFFEMQRAPRERRLSR